MNFSHKLWEFLRLLSIEHIPLLHAPQIAGREALGFRECSLQVQTDLLDNPGAPFYFLF